MAKDFAKQFYSSKTWQDTRNAYAKSVGHLCERCKDKGIITAGEIVHHKTHIDLNNIDKPDITLSFNNLEMLCRRCHGEEHNRKNKKRFFVDENGKVIPLVDGKI